ncbi:MAG: asparagine--tRNA ligase [Clostridiales bacterium]|nr:asparagine--tRNA ligase [Clostridiales bacterium]
MEFVSVKELFAAPEKYDGKTVSVGGWARTVRDSKVFGFIEINDGSCFNNIQAVIEKDKTNHFEEAVKLTTGSALSVVGTLVLTPQAKQPFEIKADDVIIESVAPADYPLQKKRHTLEYLRTIPHLRLRTNTLSAAFRMRSVASFALHKFFNERGFVYVHTPILTGSDCEGAGEMFQVTTLDMNNPPRNDEGAVDFSKDFFNHPVSLTVSGQLMAESCAMGFKNVYTFGPTFRAEKSYTARHAAEFWMLEPEMAFADLNDDMRIAEDMIKYVISYVLEQCPQEINFFNSFVDKGLIDRLNNVVNSEFVRVSYTKAIELLEKSGKEFSYPVKWGDDLQTEHERYITEEVYGCPVFVTDYPKDIKAFYMKLNEDGKTVAACDLLVPGIGEIIGGSQREEDAEKLIKRMEELNMDIEQYQWYIDLRRYGGVYHSGFGLGFERLLMYLTGISNIRDVLPFPRTTGSCDL